MTPQELKSSILQLAIQGKLVEQRPEEGTGLELFESLHFKKNNCRNAYGDDEVPFDIPNTWHWIRHNTIFEIVGGSQPPKTKFVDEPYENYVRLYQIRDYGEKPVPVYVPMDSVTKFTEKGDILLARYGGSLGKVFWAEKGAYNVALAKVMPLYDGEPIYKPYIYYFYLAPIYQQFACNTSRSAQAGFNKNDMNALFFPLPPYSEQKRIVAKIEELLPLIDRYEKAWSKLEDFNKRFPVDMQKSILQMAIQGKLVEQRPEEGTGEELYQQIQAEKQKLIKEGKIKKEKPLPEISENDIPFDIPESWKWVRLGKVIRKLTDGSHNPPPNTGSGYPVISAKNVKNGLITFENVDRYTDEKGFLKENPRTDITKGDIILGIIGGSIGNIAIYTHDAKVIAQRSIAIMSTMIDTTYFINVLKSPLIQSGMQSSAAGSAQGGVYLGTLSNFLIPLPPLAEQKRIVAKLEEILPLCKRIQVAKMI